MKLSINDYQLQIDFSFWEHLWGMHRSFRIPLRHISEVKRSLPASTWKELHAPGTFLPGVIKAGTYYTKHGKEFWNVTRKHPLPLTLELENERYRRIVLALPEHQKIPQF